MSRVYARVAELWHANHHMWEAWVWVLLTYPAFLWWKESLFYIILVSHYANFKTAISAHEGRQVRRQSEE